MDSRTVVRPLPEDWFPSSLLVVAEDGQFELAFAIRPFHSPEEILQSIKALRLAVWQQTEVARLETNKA